MVKNTTETIMYTDTIPFLVLATLSTIIALITIALFKKRMLQLRLSVFNAVILLSYQIWLAFGYFTSPDGSTFNITIVFPSISLILTILAIRSIGQDEALVRSLSRLRSTKKKR